MGIRHCSGLVVLSSAVALWVMSPATFGQECGGDFSVRSHHKINYTEFDGELDPDTSFGVSGTSIGDLDGDGVLDLAVGAYADSDGSFQAGAVWIVFLNTDGTVKAHQKISETEGGFGGDLDSVDNFGVGIASLGDLDGDGVTDLAVGARYDDDGGSNNGAVWILFLYADGTVKAHQKISETGELAHLRWTR